MKSSNKAEVELTDHTAKLLEIQSAAFRKKFGRDPQRGDPVFFDPRADEPELMEGMDAIVTAMIASDLEPHLIYAYTRTGLIVSENNKNMLPAETLDAWREAVEEFFALEAEITNN